jgi:hypothetical protein
LKIFRLSFSWMILAILMTQAAVHAGAPRLFNGQGISWMLRPIGIHPPGDPSRAQLGTLLFVQPLQPVSEAVPEAGQTGALPGLFHSTAATVSLDAYRFLPVSGGLTVLPFCTMAGVTHPGQRLCLIDADNDGTFDYQARAFGLGNGNAFAPMMFARPEPASIRYRVKTGQLGPVMNAGIVLRKEGKAYSIRLAISDGGKPKVLELFRRGSGLFASPQGRRTAAATAPGPKILDGATEKFTLEQLPLRIGLYGAVLEITEVRNAIIT